MSEHDDQRAAFFDQLRADLPPVADEAALHRVKERARALRPAQRTTPPSQRSWLVAGGLAMAAMLVAALALILTPGQPTAAFAREKAAEALLFQVPGRVLHIEAKYSEERQGAVTAGQDELDQRWSIWADAAGERVREEFTDRADGSLDELRIRADGRLTALVSRDGEKPRLLDEDASNQPVGTALGDMVDYMRARIADGSAKVTGTIEIAGEKYWIVEWTSEEGDINVTVTMRQTDYRLRTWVQVVTDGRSGSKQVERVTFQKVEQLAPETLPKDFFSREAVVKAAGGARTQ